MVDEPAFPTSGDCYGSMGMTLRDFFAAAALSGILSRSIRDAPDYPAYLAFRVADAMLKAREEEEE